MLRDITLGRYYNSQSFVHSLDPRTKIIWTVLFAVSLFVLNKAFMFVFPFAFLVYYLCVSKLSLLHVFKGLGRVLFTFAVLSLLVWFSSHSWDAVICMFLRLVFLVIGSSVLTYTTTPGQISHGLEKLIKSTDVSMIICIALRYLPILCGQAVVIYDSQRNRGAVKKGLSKSVIVPLFVSSFRMASNLGEAMDARLYGTTERTVMKRLKFTRYDLFFAAVCLDYILAVIGVRYVC